MVAVNVRCHFRDHLRCSLVFDTTGIHHVSIDYCDCGNDGIIPKYTQWLHARWFLATFIRPGTVFTFNVLKTFHELTLQGKTTLYDFYHAILRITDNAQLEKLKVRISRGPFWTITAT